MTDYAVGMFPTDYSMPPGDVGRSAEERGFESIWFSEHTNIPTSRDTPYPLGGDMPDQYWHTLDPYVAMTAAAMATTKLKVASGIALAGYRDPIILAKTIASLDLLSNGRVILGIGGGWCREEMVNHGLAYEDRWKVLRENILAMREIWTKDEPEFHGEFVDFDPLWSWPKPVQPGGPPILLGVLEGTRQFGRVVEYCDGWVPIAPAVYTSYGEDALRTGRQQMDKMRDGIRRLREAAEQAGRSSNEVNLTAYAVGGGSSPETEGLLPGAEDEARELIDMGFQRLVFILPPRKEELLLPVMDDYAELAAKVG